MDTRRKVDNFTQLLNYITNHDIDIKQEIKKKK